MTPFVEQHIDGDEAIISSELDRQNYMFRHNLKDAPSREDMDEHNRRLRQRNMRRLYDDRLGEVVKKTVDAEIYASGNHEKVLGVRSRKETDNRRTPRCADVIRGRRETKSGWRKSI